LGSISSAYFLRNEDEKFFWHSNCANGKQTAFGKKCTNLSLKFEVLIVGEIEQQIFRSPETFRLANKVW